MKINAVSANYLSYSKKSKLKNDGNQTQPINQPTVELRNQPIEQPVSPPIMGLRNQPTEQPPALTTISFKAGNKEQAILFVAETKPYFQVGGVATAMNDMRALRVSENSPEMTEAHKKSFDFCANCVKE